jgi:hypothetical protein
MCGILQKKRSTQTLSHCISLLKVGQPKILSAKKHLAEDIDVIFFYHI